jgi:hypothetical protein
MIRHLPLLALLLVGCGHISKLRPTPRGQVTAEVALGGPFARVNKAIIPLPLTTVGASYGIADRIDIGAHFHGTAAAFGIAGLDIGGSWQALMQKNAIPALTLVSRLFGFTDFKSGFQPYLEIGATGSYRIIERFSPYLNVTTLIQTNAAPLLAVGLGVEVEFGRFSVQAECRWFSPNRPTYFNAVEWQGLGGLGAVGLLLGFRYTFGEPR